MKAYARVFLQHKQQVIVFPGTGDTTFPKGVKYYWSADELEAALNDPENFGAFVMIDEGASLYGEVT
ncbi:MAG: hypothetical protein KKA05_01555, partial [Alphaproteobacteria bacterium]|nr:hypothetical protein [Alphaproteobacteria bacterium]